MVDGQDTAQQRALSAESIVVRYLVSAPGPGLEGLFDHVCALVAEVCGTDRVDVLAAIAPTGLGDTDQAILMSGPGLVCEGRQACAMSEISGADAIASLKLSGICTTSVHPFDVVILVAGDSEELDGLFRILAKPIRTIFNVGLRLIENAFLGKLREVSVRSRDLNSFMYRCINEVLLPDLNAGGMTIFYADGDRALVLSATSGIKRMMGTNLKRSDIRYMLSGQSYVVRCFRARRLLVENSDGDGLPENTFGETVDTVQNRVFAPLRFQKPPGEEIGSDGLVGVIRIVNIRWRARLQPVDCVTGHLITRLSEVLAIYANLYRRTMSLIHDQERATHGYSTDLLTIKLNLENGSRVLAGLTALAETMSVQTPTDARWGDMRDGIRRAEIGIRDMLSIQDHMAEQLLRVVQTNPNVALVGDRAELCETPYKDVFLRILGVKTGIARQFDRADIIVKSGGEDRFNEAFQRVPALMIPETDLFSIVRNILENAVKYSLPSETPVLDITWSIVRRKVRFVFRDYGIGVPSGDVASLFIEGFRGREAARILRGNGLGLYLSQQNARRAKGDLFFEHPPDELGGAMFILDLPFRSLAS